MIIVEVKKKTGMTNRPNLTDCVKSIIIPIKNGPNIAHRFPNTEKTAKADIWFLCSTALAKRLLLDACIGPTNKPIPRANIQKIRRSFVKNRPVVRTKSETKQILITHREPFVSSNLPKIKHPTIPNKLIKIPRNRISVS